MKPKTAKQKSQMGENLIKKIAQGIGNTIKATSNHPIVPKTTNDTIANQPQSSKNETGTIAITNSSTKLTDTKEDENNQINISPIKTKVQFSDGKEFDIEFKCEYGSNPYELYNLIKDDDTGNYSSVINLRNPFFEQFSDALSKPDGINQIAYVLKTMIASEVRLTNNGNPGGFAFRNEFNKLFGTL